MARSIPHLAPRQRTEIVSLAVYEGHDADIPSNAGVIASSASSTESAKTDSTHTKDLDLKDIDLEKGHASSTEPSVHEDKDLDLDPVSEAKDAGELQNEVDPNIVFWDGPDDPENPLNWSSFRRWGAVAIISALTLLTPLASSMFAPGVPELMQDFGSTNQAIEGFVVSVYVLGFAFGPLVIAPLSEMFGRLPLYHGCNVTFVIFTVACAVASDINMFIVFRFLQGTFGAAPIILGGGTIADVISREQRGTAMAVWMMGPTLGPTIGPIAGGFITQAKGWRWNFWILTILSSAFVIAAAIFMRETYAPAILSAKVRRLRKQTGNPVLRSKLDTGLTPKDLFLYSIVRPTKMLCLSPIVLITSLYMALTYAYLYILFTTFTPVFSQQYGFSRGVVGLSFVGLGVGCMFAQLYGTWQSNRIFLRRLARGDSRPENRLPMMVPGAFLLPIGLFIYGWTVQYKVHWAVPIMGSGLVGCGLMWIFMPASTYLVDVFTVHAASAMAASTVLRSVFAAVLPLAGERLYANLGYGWGNSLLAFVSVAFVPMPFLFLRYGESVRTRWVVKL